MSKSRKFDWDDIKPQTPIDFGVRSNGEFFRMPTKKDQLVEKLVLERAERNAKRVGMDRRSFLGSAAGMATTLATINMVHGCGNSGSNGNGNGSGGAGGSGGVDPSMVECDMDGARELLGGDEFVIDVQSHHIDQSMEWRDPQYGDWTETNKVYYTFFCFAFQGSSVGGECAAATPDAFPSWIDPDQGIPALGGACSNLSNSAPCLGLEDYVDLMFRKSDTTVAVLSTFPALTCEQMERIGAPVDAGICGDFLPTAAIATTRDEVNERAGSQRCLTHAAVFPNPPSVLDSAEQQRWIDESLRGMETAVDTFGIDAWKCYTPFGALPLDQIQGRTFEEVVGPIVTSTLVGEGWFLDDDFGKEMIRKAIELGRPVINIHKGIPLPTFDTVHTSARDVGIVAMEFPDARFVIYHSAMNHGAGFGAEIVEGAYDPTLPEDMQQGINSLIHSVVTAGITPATNTNVFAELGGPAARAISDPVQGTHIFGKFLKHIGEDNIVWGTDAIWGGSPQNLIEGFRMFQMDPQIAEANDYPELTPEIKRKILGLNAARLYAVDIEAKRCELAMDTFTDMRRDYQYARHTNPQPVHPREVNQGPRTRREFFKLWQKHNWMPG